MIQVYACSSLADVQQHIWQHIQGGDVLTQDWIITSHPAQNRWISQSLAQKLKIRTQIEVYSTSAWLQKIKKLAWPLAPNPISAAQITWALLSIAPEWIKNEAKSEPLKALIATQGNTLGGRRYQTAHQLAQWVVHLMRHKPHWSQAWSQYDTDCEDQSNPAWWPSLWRALDQHFAGRLHRNLCLQLCDSILQNAPRIQSQVRQMVFCGQHVYQGETLKIAQTLSQIIPVSFYSVDPTCNTHSDQDIGTSLLRTPLLQGAGMGFTAHHNHHVHLDTNLVHTLQQSDRFPDPYPRHLPAPKTLHSSHLNDAYLNHKNTLNSTDQTVSTDRQNTSHTRAIPLLKALQDVIKNNEPSADDSWVDVDHDQHAMNANDDHRLLRCMIL